MDESIIVGRHAVKEAITSGHTINKVLIQEGINKKQIGEILKLQNLKNSRPNCT